MKHLDTIDYDQIFGVSLKTKFDQNVIKLKVLCEFLKYYPSST